MSDIALESDRQRMTDASLLSWLIYPASWGLVLLAVALALRGDVPWSSAWLGVNTILIISYIVLELLVPFRAQWGATWSSVWVDFKYLVTNGVILGAVKLGLGLFAINLSGQSAGPASDWPLLLQVVAALVVFEALQYGIHRFMHMGSGPLGQFFWKMHSAHHLPPRLYVTMHVVGHPLNGFFIQTLVIVLPAWLMGYSEAACTIFLMINSIHGLMSHFNVDARMGWMNYLFVGTELHRYHHSSALREAKNFGAVLSIFDQLFGTFVYRPGLTPAALGAVDSTDYPHYGQVLNTLKYPFVTHPERDGRLKD